MGARERCCRRISRRECFHKCMLTCARHRASAERATCTSSAPRTQSTSSARAEGEGWSPARCAPIYPRPCSNSTLRRGRTWRCRAGQIRQEASKHGRTRFASRGRAVQSCAQQRDRRGMAQRNRFLQSWAWQGVTWHGRAWQGRAGQNRSWSGSEARHRAEHSIARREVAGTHKG